MAMSLAVITAAPSLAAPGDLDSPFGQQGKISEVGLLGWDVVMDGDKIVAAADSEVRRYTAAGVPDSTFGNGGKVDAPTGGCSARSIARQSDGKFVTAGCVEDALGHPDFVITRYTRKGLLDPTFGPGGVVATDIGADSKADAIAVDTCASDTGDTVTGCP